MKYEDFKVKTLEAETVITKANNMLAVSDEFAQGFHKAMREAREIFMGLKDNEPVTVSHEADEVTQS